MRVAPHLLLWENPPLNHLHAARPLPAGFAFFATATAIFGFFSYVRNVKPEARFVYYLVRARARRAPVRPPASRGLASPTSHARLLLLSLRARR